MSTWRYEPRPAVRDVDDLGGERARAIVALVLHELDLRPDWTGERAELTIREQLAGIRRVRELHTPHDIFDDCGHRHSLEEGGEWVMVEGVGQVCRAGGFQYRVCGCCCLDANGYHTEECVSEHRHGRERDAYCPTIAALNGGTRG